jgi:hypothetical protein
MRERNVGADLAALAEHGSRTGQLAAASAVRARADRRRRRRHVAGGALGVALLGALSVATALGQPGSHARPEPPAASATAPTSAASRGPATPSGTPPTGGRKSPAVRPGVLSGDRQVYLFVLDKGSEVPESLLNVLPGGRVGIGADFGDAGLFVPRPVASGGNLYQILTAKLRTGGQPSCLAVRADGSKPLTVVTAACDAADQAQLFVWHNEGRDNQGRTMYGIENQSAYLQWNPQGNSGLIAEELGDASLDTTFVVIDHGKADLPQPGK